MTSPKQTFFLTIAAAAAAHLIVSSMAEHEGRIPNAGVAAAVPASPGTTAINVALPGEETKPVKSTTPVGVPRLSGNNKRLDLAFCIDTTGSMQGEIDTVKQKLKSMVAKITSDKSHPAVRIGVVAYRDEGDAYVTKAYDFDGDVDRVVERISSLDADGGGDGPEAVEQGIHSALHELNWDENKTTAKALFLIGDAPPHDEKAASLSTEAREASHRGIRINTIACDGFESEGKVGVETFRQVANLTNGNFERLAYEQQVADADGKKVTVISEGSHYYKVKPGVKEWKEGGEALAKKGLAEQLAYDRYGPVLQGATNGTIGPQGADATVITGVNTAGTIRVNNNLDSTMLKGAFDALSGKMGKGKGY